MSRAKVATGLVVLFVAGLISGIAGTHLYLTYEREHRGERGPLAQHSRIMKRLTQELVLSPEQQAAIDLVVTRAHIAILELRFAHQTEIEDILTKGMVDLKAKLSSEQQTRLDEMYARLQRRWGRSREYLEQTKRRLAWFFPSRQHS
ncbi:MAG: hypothetical protein JSR62_05630 [Nitrospira sp.]|nr:hypothetical protein [Nitrospira sp.]